MSPQTEGRFRLGGAIVLCLIAVAAAPVVDFVVGFFADAPYVRWLPPVIHRGADWAIHDVLISAWKALSAIPGRLPL
jgi:hypothetical protein